MGWTQDKGHTKTREQGEWCAKTYDDAVASMIAHFQRDLSVIDGLAAWRFVARKLLSNAGLIPAKALRAFHEAASERLPSDPPVVEASNVFGK